MSFLFSIIDKDTMEFWNKKLDQKWYKIPFMNSIKKLAIKSFKEEYNYADDYIYNGPTTFLISDKKNNISEKSKIGIVVPIYVANKVARKQVERLIESILDLDLKTDRIYLVDDCSPMSYNTKGLKLLSTDNNSGPAKARNIGIEQGIKDKVDIIAFTDSDVILHRNWTSMIKKFFIENREYQALSGKTYSYGNTWFDLYHDVYGTLNGRRFVDSKQLLYGPTCNFAIIVEEMGDLRFSEEFPLAAGEDIEFCFNFLRKGNNIGHAKDITVSHDFAFKRLRYFRNRKSIQRVFRKYAKGERILLQILPEYYNLLKNTTEIGSK